MKTNHLLFMSAVLAISVTLFSSCKKADVYNKHQDQDEVTGLPNNSAANILGKWHVKKTTFIIKSDSDDKSYTLPADQNDYINFNTNEIFEKRQNGEVVFGIWKVKKEQEYLHLFLNNVDNQEVELYNIEVLSKSELVLYAEKNVGTSITGTRIYLSR